MIARPVRAGAVLLCAGTAQFLVAHLVVQAAWPTPYSWAGNYLSDLGAVGCRALVCSPLHAVMNAAFVLQGLLLLVGTALTDGAWRPGRRVWQGLVGVSSASWIVVGLVPEDVGSPLHAAAAVPGFAASNLALLVAAASASTRDHRVCRLAAAVLGAVGVAGLVLLAAAVGPAGGPVGVGTAERLVVFPLQVWAVVVGVALLTARRRDALGIVDLSAPRSGPSGPR